MVVYRRCRIRRGEPRYAVFDVDQIAGLISPKPLQEFHRKRDALRWTEHAKKGGDGPLAKKKAPVKKKGTKDKFKY